MHILHNTSLLFPKSLVIQQIVEHITKHSKQVVYLKKNQWNTKKYLKCFQGLVILIYPGQIIDGAFLVLQLILYSLKNEKNCILKNI